MIIYHGLLIIFLSKASQAIVQLSFYFCYSLIMIKHLKLGHGETWNRYNYNKSNQVSQSTQISNDQLLFALARYVQWQWPDTHGETESVVIFGRIEGH